MPVWDDTRLNPIFLYTANLRMDKSGKLAVTLLATAIAAILALASTPQPDYSPKPQIPLSGPTADNSPATAIRIIGIASRADLPCDQQTWPYFDRRCLNRP